MGGCYSDDFTMRAHRRSGATILCTCQPPRQFPARARGTNDYRPSCTARRRPIFIPLCGLRKAIGVSGESTPDTAPESRGVWAVPIFIPWCAGDNRDGRLVRKWCYAASIVPESHHPHTRHCYESMSRTPIRHALKWLSSAPANPFIRHSREGGNPRTNIPRTNDNRDTTTYVHTATPLRLSGEEPAPYPDTGPESRGVGRGEM